MRRDDDNRIVVDVDLEGFMSYVVKGVTYAGCWMWVGVVGWQRFDVGICLPDGRVVSPIQCAWEFMYGKSNGRFVPVCPCESCVNPEHWRYVDAEPLKLKKANQVLKPKVIRKFCSRGHARVPENRLSVSDGYDRCLICYRMSEMRRKFRKSRKGEVVRPSSEVLADDFKKLERSQIAMKYSVTIDEVKLWGRSLAGE